jgi:CBS domain-containing protein
MSPRAITDPLLHETEVLRVDDTIEDAGRRLLDGSLPALPVVDEDGRFAGIFGEREFLMAVFPGYLKELKYAGFVSRSIDDAIERNEQCRVEPVRKYMNSEHVDVGPDFSDLEIAEIFLHHRILVIPVVDDGRVLGLIRRSDFFDAIARRFLG